MPAALPAADAADAVLDHQGAARDPRASLPPRTGRDPAPACLRPPFARYRPARRNATRDRSRRGRRIRDRDRSTRRRNKRCQAAAERSRRPPLPAATGRTACARKAQFRGKVRRHHATERHEMVGDGRDAPPEKSFEDYFELDVDPMPLQQVHQAAATQRFAVYQHAVAIEDDQIIAGRNSGRN